MKEIYITDYYSLCLACSMNYWKCYPMPTNIQITVPERETRETEPECRSSAPFGKIFSLLYKINNSLITAKLPHPC